MNALTVSTEEKEAMLARAEVAVKERLARMCEQDWARVYTVLEAAENRLTESWEVVHRSRDGKKTAGRLLDGQEWNQFPNSAPESATLLGARPAME